MIWMRQMSRLCSIFTTDCGLSFIWEKNMCHGTWFSCQGLINLMQDHCIISNLPVIVRTPSYIKNVAFSVAFNLALRNVKPAGAKFTVGLWFFLSLSLFEKKHVTFATPQKTVQGRFLKVCIEKQGLLSRHSRRLQCTQSQRISPAVGRFNNTQLYKQTYIYIYFNILRGSEIF